MSLMRLTEVERYYGAQRVFGPVSISVNAGEHIGLIGRNGAGKSTLLRVMAGIDKPDAGEMTQAKEATIGYMGQEAVATPEQTVWDFTAGAVSDVKALEARLHDLQKEMSACQDEQRLAELLEDYARAQSRFEMAGGYSTDAAIKTTLFGLGFKENDLQQRFATLSGGQKARASLARLLLSSPDLLLLDEPTNHLDMDAVEWLEGYLGTYKGAAVIISHDRAFLDAVAQKIWEIEGDELLAYAGNYTVSRRLREERRARALAEYEAQQERVAELEDYVRRYKAGNRATMARSREKALNRMEMVRRPRQEQRAMHLQVSDGRRSGREVVLLEDIGKGFANKQVVDKVNLLVHRGERVGITGPNGSGKSTLLRIMAGDLQPDSGSIRYGKNVVVGYFSQELADLDDDNTMIEEILAARHMTLPQARHHLARFLFFGEDCFQQVGTLSGGERNRLTLAKLVLAEANLLLLDEPTNHLDIPSREALEESLLEYAGSLVVVSHDRYFLGRLVERVWIVDSHKVTDFPGTYDEYRRKMAQKPKEESEASATPKSRSSRDERRAAERAQARATKKAAERLATVEEAIAAAEEEKSHLEEALAGTELYSDAEKARTTVETHRQLLEKLEQLYAEWEACMTQAETGP